jgi:hypothetical protein
MGDHRRVARSSSLAGAALADGHGGVGLRRGAPDRGAASYSAGQSVVAFYSPTRATDMPPTTANQSATHVHLAADPWGPLGFLFSDLTNMIPVLGSGKISRKRIKIQENLGWWEIQFGTLLNIATSSKSSRILNYFKDSESNLV